MHVVYRGKDASNNNDAHEMLIAHTLHRKIYTEIELSIVWLSGSLNGKVASHLKGLSEGKCATNVTLASISGVHVCVHSAYIN